MGKRRKSAPRKKKHPARGRRRKPQSSTESGVFLRFYERCPKIAERETRSITLLKQSRGVPVGQYGFLETFCQDPSCDCRRTMLLVVRHELDGSRPEHVLTIGYGWEPLSFYRRWLGDLSGLDMAGDMKGPVIEPNSPLCAYGHALLDLFAESCLSSPRYVERIKRHYELFNKAP